MSTTAAVHPRKALFGAGDATPSLPVCDHYCGVEARMLKSLQLQAELGPVFDVTLDCEDGAPVGGEAEHAHLVAELAMSPRNAHGRVGARVHPVDHPSFDADVQTLVKRAGMRLAYLMVPKVSGFEQAGEAVKAIDRALREHGISHQLPVHVLIETHGALREANQIAAHARIESLSFGLMDFVSEHRGAIPQTGMSATGQFEHPLVVRAKLEIAAACHAHRKTPSHCVVTEFRRLDLLRAAAQKASRQLGYLRMWSIHPDQIRPIIEAFAPTVAETDQAIEILLAAQAAEWAPISHRETLHDRASYRYFWHVLERAQRTGQALPIEVRQAFFSTPPESAV
jgi:citrate lyase subunit beta / citryl-CoA lyase